MRSYNVQCRESEFLSKVSSHPKPFDLLNGLDELNPTKCHSLLSSWPAKCHFVGPCFRRPSKAIEEGKKDTSIKEWLELASLSKQDVM